MFWPVTGSWSCRARAALMSLCPTAARHASFRRSTVQIHRAQHLRRHFNAPDIVARRLPAPYPPSASACCCSWIRPYVVPQIPDTCCRRQRRRSARSQMAFLRHSCGRTSAPTPQHGGRLCGGQRAGCGIARCWLNPATFRRWHHPLLVGLAGHAEGGAGADPAGMVRLWRRIGRSSWWPWSASFPLVRRPRINGIRRTDPELSFEAMHAPSAASRGYAAVAAHKAPIGIGRHLLGLADRRIAGADRRRGGRIPVGSAAAGLGFLIASSSVSMSPATMFAGVLLLVITGLIGVQSALGHPSAKVVFWHFSWRRAVY